MQNLVCSQITSRIVNENNCSFQFLSCLLVSSSRNALFTLGVESGEEDSLFLFASQEIRATFDVRSPWNLSSCCFLKTRVADWKNTNSISSFVYLEETDSVVVSLSTGEIFQIPCLFNYHSKNNARVLSLEGFGQTETVGIFPQGIHCMQSSPDGEVLCLLTGKSRIQIVFMATEDWEILSQQDLCSLEQLDDISQQGNGSLLESVPSAWNISWRSDGAFVSITYPLGSSNKIQMQVFRRERFVLESTCEEVWEGSWCCVGWQPRVGGAIAAHVSNESIIRFYETNGLALRRLFLDAEIDCKQLQWSEQYPLLVCGDETKIRIFYHSNYHWYLKQEWIFSEFGEIAAFQIMQDRVATDRNILYVLTTNGMILCLCFQWQFDICKLESDECYLAAIDGNEIAITIFSRQIIPAPLCSLVLVCSCPIQRVEMDSKGGCLALLSNGAMEYFSYSTIMNEVNEQVIACTKGRQLENSLGKIYKENNMKICQSSCLLPPLYVDKKQSLVWKAFTLLPIQNSNNNISFRIVVIGERVQIYLCNCKQGKWDYSLEFSYLNGSREEEGVCLDIQPVIPKEEFNSYDVAIWLSEERISFRDIMNDDKKDYGNISLQVLGLKGHQITCLKSANVTKKDKSFNEKNPFIALFFLDEHGRLWMALIQLVSMMADSSHSPLSVLLISEECVSFEVTCEFLFFTSRFHKLYTCSMDMILDALEENVPITKGYRKMEWNEKKKVDCRPIDRFSRIMTFVSDKSAKRNNCLILQAPRGNLECIVPRLVIQRIVEGHIEHGAYEEAYRLCRRHRLSMDILVEKSPERFKENLLGFLRHFKDPEHLNTFVSMLGSEQEDTIRNEWCTMLIESLRQLITDDPKYRYPLICAFLQKKPADVSGALEVLQLNVSDISEYSRYVALKEDLMDFLLLLTKDSVLVFREALSLYDLSLAALVVERASDLDPAYYGALLQRLEDTCPEKQKYLIDLELGNMESALRHLFAFSTFPTNSDTVVEFAIQHRLFPLACSLLAEYPEMLKRVRQAYAEDLSRNGQHLEAACFYSLIEQEQSARDEYKRACVWQLVTYLSHKLLWKRIGSSYQDKKHSTCEATNVLHHDQDFVSEMNSLVEHLRLNGKGKEAAFIILDYLDDPQAALEELIHIEEWLDAIGILGRIPFHEFWRVVETTWQPALINAVQEHTEEWKEVMNKMGYYCERLEQARRNNKDMNTRENEYINQVHVEDEVLSESDVSSQSVSSLGEWTMSSDTSKASLYSLLSKKGQKRKPKKKSKNIKPGDPREEEYLVDCLSKMIPSCTRWDTLNKLVLCLIGMCMEKEARKLYEVMRHFESCVQRLPEDIAGRSHFIQVCFQEWKCLNQ